MKVRIQFKWYDLWIGVYIEQPTLSVPLRIYICIIPTIAIRLEF